jgi:hypothetical protein
VEAADTPRKLAATGRCRICGGGTADCPNLKHAPTRRPMTLRRGGNFGNSAWNSPGLGSILKVGRDYPRNDWAVQSAHSLTARTFKTSGIRVDPSRSFNEALPSRSSRPGSRSRTCVQSCAVPRSWPERLTVRLRDHPRNTLGPGNVSPAKSRLVSPTRISSLSGYRTDKEKMHWPTATSPTSWESKERARVKFLRTQNPLNQERVK